MLKFCMDYYNKFRYKNKLDEVVYYTTLYKTKEELVNDITKEKWNSEQRIILDMYAGIPYNIVDIVNELSEYNISLRINLLKGVFNLTDNEKTLIKILKENNIPFFFKPYTIEKLGEMDYPSNLNLDLIRSIQLGATDVYLIGAPAFPIVNQMLFNIPEEITIRVIPNYAQGKISSMGKFFIRPEDCKYYEYSRDIVFEFIELPERLSVLFNIYSNRYWKGNLDKIIYNFDEPIKNSTLVPFFGYFRTMCNRQCDKGKCVKCFEYKEFANKLNEKNIVFSKEQEKNENKEDG